MKKSLIALAALASVAGVAQAQSSVTLYGVLDAGYASFDTQRDGAAKNKIRGISYSSDDTSRWGITSTEDLGGGLKAGITIESTLSGNARDNFGYNGSAAGIGSSSATNLFTATSGQLGNTNSGGSVAMNGAGFNQTISLGDRQLNAFAQSGAHKVVVGIDSSLIRAAVVPFQADGSNLVGNFVGNDRSLTGGSIGQGRIKAITYTNDMGAVKASVGYAAGSSASGVRYTDGSTAQVANGFQLALNYAQGPLAAVAAYAEYQGHVPVQDAVAASTTGGMTTIAATTTATDIKTKQTALGASYDLTVAKLFAQYGKVDIKDSLVAGTNGGNGTGGDKRDMWSFGARVPMGKGWAFAQVSQGHDQNGTSDLNGKMNGYSVGYKYNLSARTRAYVGYGYTKVDTGTQSAKVGVKSSETMVGMVHTF